MWNRLFPLAVVALLAGCSSTNPFTTDDTETDGGTTDGGTGTGADDEYTAAGIPVGIAGNVTAINFIPGDATIKVEGLDLDNTPFSAEYTRNAALDVPGYHAYTTQDDPLDRHITAFVMQTGNSGAVRGGVAVTGGQFNTYFGGTYYERDGSFTPPTVSATSGLVSYAGKHVDVTNVADTGGDLLPVPAGTDPSIVPSQAAVIRSDIFINADFADNRVNGGIYNRTIVNFESFPVPNLALVAADIDADGRFEGNIEYEGVVGKAIGNYSGIFGGPDAEGVAGGTRMSEWDGEGNPLGLESEEAYGLFVLDKCGTAAATAPECASVNP